MSQSPDTPENPPQPETEAATPAAETPAAPEASAPAASAPVEAEASPAAEAAPVADAAPAARTEEAAAESAAAPSGGEGEAAETGAEGGETSAGDVEAEGEGEGGKKKKRRRRKKKKKPADAAASAAQVPFLAYFEARGGKPHAFSNGEVVAGRVAEVTKTTIVVDLFGKAKAVTDIHEPRDVPALPEPAPKPEAKPEVTDETPPPEAATSAEGGAPDAVASEHASAPSPEAATDTEAVAPPGAAESSPEAAVTATEATTPEAETPSEPAAIEAPADATPAKVVEAAEAAEGGAPDAGAEDSSKSSEPSGEASAPAEAPKPAPIDLTGAAFLATAKDPEDAPEPPEVGGIFRGRIASVAESGHIVLVNRIIDKPAAKKEIAAAREQKLRVRGLVYGFNRGGFDVLVNGVRAFCPARAMSLQGIEDPEAFIGQRLEFSLPPLKGSGRSIIVSRRSILEKEARKAARERMKQLKVGERLPGKVTDVRDYGVIVDIGGGVDGLVHQSEVSWQRGVRMSEIVSPGDPVEVEVLKVHEPSRKDRYGKLSLSIKRCLPDPWDAHKDILQPGHVQEGKVTRTAEFGAFIELVPGIEGLLHISELGGRDLKHAKDVLKEGQTLDIMIERVDRKARKLGLSKLSEADKKAIEAGEFDPAQARKLKPGAHVDVVIERVEHHGLFVRVKGVIGKRGRGYLSRRDLGEADGTKKRLGQGDELKVKITGTDRDGQLRCSVKHREFDEERKAVRDYRKEASKHGLGTFGDLLRAKLGGDDDKA